MPRLHTHSQHFLRSPRLVAELIGHSNLRKNDTVVDLGAGSGVITSTLARRVKYVLAVENEPQALASLMTNIDNLDNVEVINDDILNFMPPQVPYKIFSNIPFSISSPIIRRFTSIDDPPKSIYLIAQKQFAKKLIMSKGHFTSQLGAQISPWWLARIRKPLRKTDFTPPPAVDTVLLELKQVPEPLLSPKLANEYRQFIEKCFSSQTYFGKLAKDAVGISPERKPSELTANQWVELFKSTKNIQ